MSTKTFSEYLKEIFIGIAYISYCIVVALKNELKIDLGRFEYMFCAIIMVCLWLSKKTHYIDKFVISDEWGKMMEEKMDIIMSQNGSVLNSHRDPMSDLINEPYDINTSKINIDDLIKARKLLIGGYEITLNETPRI